MSRSTGTTIAPGHDLSLNSYQDRSGRSGAGFATLNRYQVRPGGGFVKINDVARVCYVDRVPGLWQGSDLLRYRDVTGACLVAKNLRFAA